MAYLAEPDFAHGSPSRTAILLINLGTPDAPTFWAVRRYLKEFLSDHRVVEIPRAIWWLILNGIILWARPGASAHKYATIWTNEGSPLRVHTAGLATAMRNLKATHGPEPVLVDFAMRYGSPSIASAMNRLHAQGAERVLMVPLYPQYAASTTGAAYDGVGTWLRQVRNVPEIRWIRHYHDHPAYIRALTRRVSEYWEEHGRPTKLLMSFHGLPRYTLDKGDPYHCECHKTARLLAESLGLSNDQWQLSFQSRFGRARWLEPYTSAILQKWGNTGMERVDVFCPGFVADCLETLEEIGIEGRQSFLAAGGREYHLIPCLNEHEDWISALIDITGPHLAGWTAQAPFKPEESRRRAMALGAKK